MPSFYAQHANVDGIMIEASAQVSPYALAEAEWLLRHVVSAKDRRSLGHARVRVVVLGTSEMTTDLPEYADLTPQMWYNRRYRAMGPTDALPVVLCPEEDLLALPGDEDPGSSDCTHELAHAVEYARRRQGPWFNGRMVAAYKHAMAMGLWADTYSASHASEYFANGAKTWLSARQGARTELHRYDPQLATLLASVWEDDDWRYTGPWDRVSSDRTHLEGFDPSRAAPFVWPETAQWEAIQLPWAEDPPAASPPTDTESWLIFANYRQENVEIGWIDHDGVRRHWFPMYSGHTALKDAYVGHVWYVEQDGRELGQVVAAPGVGYVEIGPSPPPPLDQTARATWNLEAMRLPWANPGPAVSPASDEMTWLLLVNHRAKPVIVEWLDFEGGRRLMQTLAPGQELLRDAFVGHVWCFREDGGAQIGAVVVTPGVGYVELR